MPNMSFQTAKKAAGVVAAWAEAVNMEIEALSPPPPPQPPLEVSA